MIPEHEVKALLRETGVAVPRGVAVAVSRETVAPRDGIAPREGSPRGDGHIPAGGHARGRGDRARGDGDRPGRRDRRGGRGAGSPLVLKAYGPDLVHKSDAGAVRLALGDAAEAGAAAAEMLRALLNQGITPDGFLVEEQAAPGIELILGIVDDPGFGPVLLTGLGGVWTEAMRDTALRLCPVSEADAREMLASLRGAPLLEGYRGRPAVDVDALVELLVTVGGPGGLWERLELGEFELNPVIATEKGVIAVDARYIPADPAHPRHPPPTVPPGPGVTDFAALFEPRAVAVVGASTSRPNFGNMFLEFYKTTGVPLVAVHPEADAIDGVPAVPSLAGVEADYALVAVPAGKCAEVVRQARGIPFVQVMSGGFGEAGRPDLEAALIGAAAEAGTRLLGPNCMGVYSPRGRQTFVGGEPGPPGHVALISQSGGLAGEVIKVGERRGLAFSRVATVGNSADVTPAELLRWLAADEQTSAVGMYLEDPRGGRALFEALMSVRGRLPVVLLVGGRSAQGGGPPPRTPAAWSATPGSGAPGRPDRRHPRHRPGRPDRRPVLLPVPRRPPPRRRPRRGRRGAGGGTERRGERAGRRRLRRGRAVARSPAGAALDGLKALGVGVGSSSPTPWRSRSALAGGRISCGRPSGRSWRGGRTRTSWRTSTCRVSSPTGPPPIPSTPTRAPWPGPRRSCPACGSPWSPGTASARRTGSRTRSA
nr:hypothetical protein GCM10020093_101780 [Planobispora longispora]